MVLFLLAAPFATAAAQPLERVPRVGFLGETPIRPVIRDAFLQGLWELGWAEGKNIVNYSKAVRGKYCRRLLKEGANVVVLEPDVAKAFRSSAAVNEALRSLLKMSEAT